MDRFLWNDVNNNSNSKYLMSIYRKLGIFRRVYIIFIKILFCFFRDKF